MGREDVLRTCLVSLGAAVLAVGFFTFSVKKMIATYIFGILGISGIMLPDWEYFDRDFSQWLTPMPADSHSGPVGAFDQSSRFKFHPLRVTMLTAVYSFGIYKWWGYMAS
ncbi:peptidase [Wolffia australiana]